jgi:hypothetical protein
MIMRSLSGSPFSQNCFASAWLMMTTGSPLSSCCRYVRPRRPRISEVRVQVLPRQEKAWSEESLTRKELYENCLRDIVARMETMSKDDYEQAVGKYRGLPDIVNHTCLSIDVRCAAVGYGVLNSYQTGR